MGGTQTFHLIVNLLIHIKQKHWTQCNKTIIASVFFERSRGLFLEYNPQVIRLYFTLSLGPESGFLQSTNCDRCSAGWLFIVNNSMHRMAHKAFISLIMTFVRWFLPLLPYNALLHSCNMATSGLKLPAATEIFQCPRTRHRLYKACKIKQRQLFAQQ